ncbi:MAG: S41 family peptidase [Gemmatimonadaceae bacterium]|nr:S41 family peptidase [Gemmatimonadaceae bacterium]
MKSRGVVAAAVLTCALVTGGWLMERGTAAAARPEVAGERLFAEVLQHLRRDYVDTLADSALYRRAVDGALHELHDPHSVFLDPRRLSRFTESTSGHYAGVGIQMDVRDNGITVVAALPGTPASEAGIVTGDRIAEIEGHSTFGFTIDEAFKSLRGAVGTTVHVMVERPGVAARIPFALTRREISVHPVQHATMLRDGTGYVDLTIFSAAAAAELVSAIDSLRRAGARALVFDLRGNPGGLLNQGVAVSDLFLEKGQTIVTTRGRTLAETRAFADDAAQRWRDMPIIVLTDSGSASASEIVAGALQDHDRALVVGTTTYGKGSAQSLFRVADGALKLTTALWYTPSGRSINRLRPGTDDGDSDLPPPDSAARPRFRTDGGRTVLGGGGIVPDVEAGARPLSDTDKALGTALGSRLPRFRDATVEYVLSLKAAGAMRDTDFVVTPAMRAELYVRLQRRGVTLDAAIYERASSAVDRELSAQIARYVFGPRAEFARRQRDDPALVRALELLHGVMSPKGLLDRSPSH